MIKFFEEEFLKELHMLNNYILTFYIAYYV